MIPLAQADHPFTSIEDLWRRAGISVSALERLADADAYGSLRVSRRDALWTIRGLSDEPLPLFAAADERDSQIRSEGDEPHVELTPMTEGREVVEDYRSKGLTLRQHPISFLREELTAPAHSSLRGNPDDGGWPTADSRRDGSGATETWIREGSDVHDDRG